jgi:hypothetical protein
MSDIEIALPTPIERLLGELASDCGLSGIADQFRRAFEMLEQECSENWHASQLMCALALASEQRRPLRDKLIDVFELIEVRGKVVAVIRKP